MVRIYRVAFYKRLVDSNGHPVDACQGVVEVRGPNKERARTDARLRFAELKGVSPWSLRADYEIVETLHTRKRVSAVVWTKSLATELISASSMSTRDKQGRIVKRPPLHRELRN